MNRITNGSAGSASSQVFWAGIAIAIGAFGVVVASAFYAISPVLASLPVANLSIDDALAATIAGRTTMVVAGTVGIVSDIFLAAGALVLLVLRDPAGLSVERIGWAFVTISVSTFVVVDSLSSRVITRIASLEGAAAAFAGFKLLYNILFVLGSIAFGIGAPCIFLSEMKSSTALLARPLLWIGTVFALAGLLSGLLYLFEVSLPQVTGISIAVGSLIFVIYGIQIARRAR